MCTEWGLPGAAAPWILPYEQAHFSYVYVCGDGEKQNNSHTPDECLMSYQYSSLIHASGLGQ